MTWSSKVCQTYNLQLVDRIINLYLYIIHMEYLPIPPPIILAAVFVDHNFIILLTFVCLLILNETLCIAWKVSFVCHSCVFEKTFFCCWNSSDLEMYKSVLHSAEAFLVSYSENHGLYVTMVVLNFLAKGCISWWF